MCAEECETRQITRERYHAQIYVVNADASHATSCVFRALTLPYAPFLSYEAALSKKMERRLHGAPARPKTKALEVDREREWHRFDHKGPPTGIKGRKKIR